MVITLSNYDGTGTAFSFPYNPITFDDTIDANHQTTNIDFSNYSFIVSGGGSEPREIVLTGHFSGSSKETYYRELSKTIAEKKIKMLNFHGDKFYLCIPKQVKRTSSGGRTNFIDYVVTFETIIHILFGSTLRTSGTNAGDATTYIQRIDGRVSNGTLNVVISDALGNQFTIPQTSLDTGDYIRVELVEFVDDGSGFMSTEYIWVKKGTDGVHYTAIGKYIQNTGYSCFLQLAVGANISTITTTNLTSVTKYFRDGWSG